MLLRIISISWRPWRKVLLCCDKAEAMVPLRQRHLDRANGNPNLCQLSSWYPSKAALASPTSYCTVNCISHCMNDKGTRMFDCWIYSCVEGLNVCDCCILIVLVIKTSKYAINMNGECVLLFRTFFSLLHQMSYFYQCKVCFLPSLKLAVPITIISKTCKNISLVYP